MTTSLIRKWMPAREKLPASTADWPGPSEPPPRPGIRWRARSPIPCGPPDRCFYARSHFGFETLFFLRTFPRALLTESAISRLRSLAHVNLPGIEQVFNIGVEPGEDGEAYVESDCCDGASLADLAAALHRIQRPLPWPLALAIFHEAYTTLRRLHEKTGVIHGGVRPTLVRLSLGGTLCLCWGLSLQTPPPERTPDVIDLARCVLPLAAGERRAQVESVLARGDRGTLAVLSDLIAEAEPSLAEVAALVLWSGQDEEAEKALAGHVSQSEVVWLWTCLAPFFARRPY